MNFKSCQFFKSIFFIGNRSFIGQNSASETKSCRDSRAVVAAAYGSRRLKRT